MIIVNLSGGLGNQMFQYAFGQSLQNKMNTEVKYKTYFDGLVNRKFELNHFNISGKLIGDNEFELFQRNKKGFFKEVKSKLTPYYKKEIVRESHYHFDPNLFSVPSHCLIEGYFQSEKYFVDIADNIREEFSFKTQLEGENKILSESITKSESIGLHVRRGDYLLNPLFRVYGLEYYQKAIEQILNVVEKPEFYVFSNDNEWCEENIRLDYPLHFVTLNTEQQPYFDLFLMSLCKHNIIANSSFSWWAAWLNRHPNKKIIAPSPWVNRSTPFYSNMEDIVPKQWTKIYL